MLAHCATLRSPSDLLLENDKTWAMMWLSDSLSSSYCVAIQRPSLSSLAWLVIRSISWVWRCCQVRFLRCLSSVKELGSCRSSQNHLLVHWTAWSSLELKIHCHVVISCRWIVISCCSFQKYRQVVACPSSTSRTTLFSKKDWPYE